MLAKKINDLTNESDNRKSLDIAIETANEIIALLNPRANGLKTGEDALDDNIPINKFPNYKVESWFAQHPYFSGERVALNFYESETVQIKFYWLGDSATKSRVSAGVMLTPNWEDSDLTRNDQYKVGIDFFLSANTKSLLMVASNKGNLRILEFSDRLSNTQQDILTSLKGVLSLGTKDQIHKTLWDALALSEVNKKFYLGIAEKFNELLSHLIADGKDAEDSKLFASRLLGRLLFIWFLRRKNIIQEQYGYFNIDSPDNSEYYDQKLKKLFFNTLNIPVSDRQLADTKTPYLNGGLFEAHDNDWVDQKVSFPTGFFNRLYEHLEQYNFTTDESSTEYEQVAIDPEMLGRVFESLLATQVTETGDQARKAKGAFYTPREIVSYMCKESLRQYLYTKLDNKNQNEGIDKLLDIHDSEWELQHSNAKRNLWGERDRNIIPAKVLQSLDDLKVLDPACGSGAFPMGMLQLMLKTYERLDGRFDAYKTKLRIIQENIYGVDIEPMAVEISRLRAWLSLIVDDEGAQQVAPLPNLDFKFVCANSLIPLDREQSLFADPELHQKLKDIRIKYFNARLPKSKNKLQSQYNMLIDSSQQTFMEDLRSKQLKSFNPFKNTDIAEFFDADQMFGVDDGFDIIIGNPPYGAKISVQEKQTFQKIYYSAKTNNEGKGSTDTFSIFLDAAYTAFSKQIAAVAYIVPMAFTSGGSMEKIHKLILQNSNHIYISNYSDRPKKIFDSAEVACSIFVGQKGSNKCTVYTTKINKRYSNVVSINEIINTLVFVNSTRHLRIGRIPKIGNDIENDILDILYKHSSRFNNYESKNGHGFYYRSTGGRYYNIITNFETLSSEERMISVQDKYRNVICAIYSSSLYYWYYHCYSDNLHIKKIDIYDFPLPDLRLLDDYKLQEISELYEEYIIDLENNSKLQNQKRQGRIKQIKIYYARKSKFIIDKIDRLICPIYGLNEEQTNFIINYELVFRTDAQLIDNKNSM